MEKNELFHKKRFYFPYLISVFICIGQSFATNQDVAAPTNAADNWTRIDAAIQAASSSNGGFVRLESGDYTITGTLVIQNNVVLVGCGMYATRLILDGAAIPNTVLNFANAAPGKIYGGLRDLSVLGRGRTSSTNDTGINVRNTLANPPDKVFIQNCRIADCAVGIRVQNWKAEINQCHLYSCGTGVWGVFHMESSDDMQAVNCHFRYMDTCVVTSGHYNEMTGCQFMDFNHAGVVLHRGWTNRVIDCSFETPGDLSQPSSAIGIWVRSTGNLILNSYFNMEYSSQQWIVFETPDIKNRTTVIGCNYRTDKTNMVLANDSNRFAVLTNITGSVKASGIGINCTPQSLVASNSLLNINHQTVGTTGTLYTALSSNNNRRFGFGLVNQENGNSGADFTIRRFTLAPDEAVRVNRDNGLTTFYGKIAIGGGNDISKYLSATQNPWNPSPATIANLTSRSTKLRVTGARSGDPVVVALSTATSNGLLLSGSVTSNDTVTVTLGNASGSSKTIASNGVLKVGVWQH